MKPVLKPGIIGSLLLSSCLAAACSGGGGGEGGSGRTTGTGVRIIHASIDTAPAAAKIGEVFLQSAQYAIPTEYVPVNSGPTIITVESSNSPGSGIANLSQDLKEATEYTIWLLGETRRGDFRTILLEDPVARPAAGTARVQLLNALPGSPPVAISGTGFSIPPAGYSTSSGFVDAPVGPQTATVSYSNGRIIGTVPLDLLDQGEATVVVSGSSDLRVVFTRVYYDLD